MKTKISILLCAVLSLASPGLYAATHVVLPGESIQAAITSASPGDQIIIKGGTYVGENITINKNLDIRREQNASVSITGGITFTGLSQLQSFAHFSVTGNLMVTNSKVYLYDCNATGSLTTTGSEWTLQECNIGGNVSSTSSTSKFMRSYLTGSFTHDTNTTDCTVFQSTIREKLTTKAQRSWIGYNTIRYMRVDKGHAEIAGNVIDGRGGKLIGLQITGANTFANVRNNEIFNGARSDTSTHTNTVVGIWISTPANATTIVNNYIHDWKNSGGYHWANDSYLGIRVVGPAGEVKILGNKIANCTGGDASNSGTQRAKSIYAPFEGVTMMYNWFNNGKTGGVLGQHNISTGTGVDLGPPEPRFNDHDGSRNDIGKNGGHAYDSNGTTASRPVILSAELAPLTIQQGVTGTVKIKTRAAVSTPRQ
jgi:hypothetical protein